MFLYSSGDVSSKEDVTLSQMLQKTFYFQSGKPVVGMDVFLVLGKWDRAEDNMGMLHCFLQGEREVGFII